MLAAAATVNALVPLCCCVYANVLYMSRGWIADGSLPPQLGTWWVHGLVVAVALLWIRRQGRVVGKG